MRMVKCENKGITISRAHPDDGGHVLSIGCATCGRRSVSVGGLSYDAALAQTIPDHEVPFPESSIECEEINGKHGDIAERDDRGVFVCSRCGL